MSKRKRSRHVALVLAGSAVLGLAACKDEQVDAQSFPDLESCIAAAKDNSLWFTETDCRTNFAMAEKEYLETAPRYESRELCEQEHGVGKCGTDPVATTQPGADPAQQQAQGGGGFSFMPLLVGYMMGSMLSRGGGIFSQPMVQTANGRYTTPSGNQSFATNKGAGRVPAQVFTNRAATTLGKPPLTRSAVQQRGGFGAATTQRSSGSRGFGG